MSDRIAIPLPDGRWLTLSADAFASALAEGNALAAPCSAPGASGEPLCDAEHAAEQLGVTARWLEDCARAGIVPHHKFGRVTRYRVSEVAAHFRVSGAPVPTDNPSVTPFRRQARQ